MDTGEVEKFFADKPEETQKKKMEVHACYHLKSFRILK